MGIQGLVLWVKTGDVIGAGEHHALDPVFARRFIKMKGAADIGVENRFERPLNGNPTHVHDGIHVLDQGVHGLFVGQVAVHDFVMGAGAGCQGAGVGGAHDMRVGLQGFPQDLPQAAGGAGQQNAVEGFGCGHVESSLSRCRREPATANSRLQCQ